MGTTEVAQYKQELRSAALRATSGRVAVLRALESAPHSSAERVFALISDDLPGTSPQAVYMMLNDLARAGLIRKFEPAGSAALAHAKDDLSIAGVKAAFVMAPALVQSLDPDSLKRLRPPVRILLGDADKVAPPATNGEVAAALIPGAKLTALPHVGHYDFLAECTPAGDVTVPVCPTEVPRTATHKTAIDEALAFFDATLGAK